ncbi:MULTISPECIES: hypothetical protein [unclassified Streptomyces]|uniref:hypothetical protein n=1 Tax=unclassified Streptomyces TaxID=2593676 RepID=UPI00131A2D80|nr:MULTISPECIES: hypothetical protein [unclassified Streptomyces]MYX36741.1 hypothetical protein [Streptomyces sp. SID8377]
MSAAQWIHAVVYSALGILCLVVTVVDVKRRQWLSATRFLLGVAGAACMAASDRDHASPGTLAATILFAAAIGLTLYLKGRPATTPPADRRH